MSTLSQFMGGGGLKPTGLINGSSALNQVWPFNSVGSGPLAAGSILSSAKKVLSGSLTASTLKTILSLSGKGAISFLSFSTAIPATARTQRMVVTLDGNVIFDGSTSQTQDATYQKYHWPVIGDIPFSSGSTWSISEIPLFFDSSLLIQYSSSLTETDITTFAYRYYPR